MARILSGIQPSGVLHIGNYIGAVRQWLDLQHNHETFFCIVDYHAITVPQDPEELTKNIYSLVALYLAVGLDPKKVILFKQSDVPAHTELAWILSTLATMGELERMTQYKEKAQKGKRNAVGLFVYPVLMAADILLYQTELVPVGEDQTQHLELTRDIAERFNRRFGHTFTIPQSLQPDVGSRIMSLDDPTKKMSKSATSVLGYIALTDAPDVVTKKIKKAVTDSGTDVRAGVDKPAMTNLLTIYSTLSGKSIAELEQQYKGMGYVKFKGDLAIVLVEWLRPIQERYEEYINDFDALRRILNDGAERAKAKAQQTLLDVKCKIGVL